ncbi:MAG TPA: DoxX family protein [Bryobacteraceae bacterium]|nr:DoxX family protein [Bryobacteraceae bacterium]
MQHTSKAKLWTGRIFSSLVVLFCVFDSIGKFLKPAPVVEGFARLGFPVSLSIAIGAILLACTILYAVPRTAILGAVLLTGYLGGAVASQLRAGEPLFGYVLFPVYFGFLLWMGLYLRENRLRDFIGLRS